MLYLYANNCIMHKKFTTEEWIRRAKEVHGDKYDYSKVEYIDSKHDVTIICPKHGEFTQRANRHIQGCGCRKCSNQERGLSQKLSNEEWIRRAKEIHGDKYDYSKVEYIDCHKKVCIICPKHGEFWQRPNSHTHGYGCPKCASESRKIEYSLCKEEFIKNARKIHGDKYDYSKVKYINNYTKVCIICPEHGEFWQTPGGHIHNFQGCPMCRKSRMEDYTKLLLERENISFEIEKTFDWLVYNNRMKLDFLCGNVAIECQGGQHFVSVAKYGGDDALKLRIDRDDRKYRLCKEHGIDILYVIPYRYRNTKIFRDFYVGKKYVFFKNIDNELTDRLRAVL